MKRFSLLLTVFSCLFLIGCEDTTIKAKIVEGILLSVEDYPYKVNQTYGWKVLKFQDGRSVMVNFGPGDSLYIGHYQEIKINDFGFIVNVKCKSFEKLIAKSGYKKYNVQQPEKLVADLVLHEKDE